MFVSTKPTCTHNKDSSAAAVTVVTVITVTTVERLRIREVRWRIRGIPAVTVAAAFLLLSLHEGRGEGGRVVLCLEKTGARLEHDGGPQLLSEGLSACSKRGLFGLLD